MEKYTHSYTVSASDMDKYYRLQPTAILGYFEDCFARYMSCLNLAAFDLVKENKLWVITEFSAIRSEVEAYWSEDINIEMWISEITPLRIYSDFRVIRCTTQELLSSGTSCWSIINAETRKLERTDFLKDKITIVPQIEIEHKKRRFATDGVDIASVEHKVNLLDLDFNGHVNNRSYLSIAMLTTTDEFLATHSVRFFTVHWIMETYLEDTISCNLKRINPEENKFIHTLKNSSGNNVAQIYSEWAFVPEIIDIASIIERI